MAVLEDLIAHAEAGECVGVIFGDIDRLKSFNDRYGHSVGDQMLWALARMMEAVVGRDVVVARFGGDEFLVVAEKLDATQSLKLAEVIRAGAAGVVVEHNGEQLGPLTLTLGVACFPDDGDSALKLLEEADLAVVIGKNHGKNRVLPARNPLRREAPPY